MRENQQQSKNCPLQSMSSIWEAKWNYRIKSCLVYIESSIPLWIIYNLKVDSLRRPAKLKNLFLDWLNKNLNQKWKSHTAPGFMKIKKGKKEMKMPQAVANTYSKWNEQIPRNIYCQDWLRRKQELVIEVFSVKGLQRLMDDFSSKMEGGFCFWNTPSLH